MTKFQKWLLAATIRPTLGVAIGAMGALMAACGTDAPTDPRPPVLPTPAFSYAAGTVFGQVVGSIQGVNIYSNSPVGKPSPAPTWQYGEKWQCVEFARRYTSLRYGTWLPSVTFAIDFWGKSLPGMRRVANGGVEFPQTGDLIIMSGSNGQGHIAVVESISSTSIVIAQQNTVSAKQSLSMTTSMLGGTKRYKISALTNHSTLGWFTRKAPPILVPSILSHAPLSIRTSNYAQQISLTTRGIAEGVVLYLYDPYGNRIKFERVNLSLTATGLVFRPNLYQAGRWSVQLQVGGLTSTRYYFSVAS